MSNILFINTLHSAFDDRTFYHQAKCLKAAKHEVSIFSNSVDISTVCEGINIVSENITNISQNKQTARIHSVLLKIQPTITICDSPVGVFACLLYKRKNKCTIIYDVTEWIPSKKFLHGNSFILNFFKFFILLLANIAAGIFSDKHIYGEFYKSKLFSFLNKPKLISSYFPDLDYIPILAPDKQKNKIKLLYSGYFSIDKGIDKVVLLANEMAKENAQKSIELTLIGGYTHKHEKIRIESYHSNLTIITKEFLSFKNFCAEITLHDIFLDLRVNDLENTHCLPIKLFYYLACGRPVVYTDLKAIKQVIDISEVGFTYNKQDTNLLAKEISEYMTDEQLYLSLCNKARALSQDLYNWALIKNDFLKFVTE